MTFDNEVFYLFIFIYPVGHELNSRNLAFNYELRYSIQVGSHNTRLINLTTYLQSELTFYVKLKINEYKNSCNYFIPSTSFPMIHDQN